MCYNLSGSFPKMNISPELEFVKMKFIDRNGKILLVFSRNNILEFYQEDSLLFTLYTPKNSGYIIDFKFVLLSEKNLYVLIASELGRLSLWDLNPVKEISHIFYPDTPTALDYSDTGIGFLGTNTVILHTFTIKSLTLKHDKNLKISNPGVSNIVIRPDNKLVAISSIDNLILLVSLENLKPVAALKGDYGSIRGITFIENKKENKRIYLMASAFLDGKIILWDSGY